MPITEEKIQQSRRSNLVLMLQNNRRIFLFIAGILILLFGIYYLYISSGLRLVSVIPESGQVQTPDTFQIIVFDFSEPINMDTLEIETDPPRIIKPLILTDYPNRLSILPALIGWDPGVEYTIKITALTAQDGTKLRSPVMYKYFNSFDFDKIYEDAPY